MLPVSWGAGHPPQFRGSVESPGDVVKDEFPVMLMLAALRLPTWMMSLPPHPSFVVRYAVGQRFDRNRLDQRRGWNTEVR